MRSEKMANSGRRGRANAEAEARYPEPEIKNAEIRPEELEVVKRKLGVACSDDP
jgi:hypothetical protein